MNAPPPPAPGNAAASQAQSRQPGGAVAPWLPLVLAMSALVWTFAAWLSRANLDAAGDMVENYAWGIEWQAGYFKHPPLFAWIAAAWFSVLPRTDLAYFALSALNASLGLIGVAALARRFLSSHGAAFAALALAVSPLYTGLAIKFNANAVLLSIWPWTAYFCVAFVQTGRRRNAAACGVMVGLALLGKYFSLVLVVALLIAILGVPAWRQRLRGLGPWLAVAAALAVLAPHVQWMFDHQFSTLRFASQRSQGEWVPALLRLVNYTVAQVGYLLPSAIFLLWSLAPTQRRAGAVLMLRALVRPDLHRPLWWLSFAPMIAIAAIAVLLRTPMASVWGMAQWFALTALWLGVLDSQGIVPRGPWLRRALPLYWVGVLAVAAVVGCFDARRAAAAATEPRAELAHAAHALWREHTGRPLALVGGAHAEAMSVAFYGPGKARWWHPGAPAVTPWITPVDWQRDGSLLVCARPDTECQRVARGYVSTPPVAISLHKDTWGARLPPHDYLFYLLLPQ
ncbi:MAG: glycosyltransferase family 39 protein [Burkholderiaceae bacterium]